MLFVHLVNLWKIYGKHKKGLRTNVWSLFLLLTIFDFRGIRKNEREYRRIFSSR